MFLHITCFTGYQFRKENLMVILNWLEMKGFIAFSRNVKDNINTFEE